MTAAARILVVDDDDDSRSICEEILSVAGHRVITAADGEEAIAYALRVPFDLIVLDLCLPKVDGIGVIKELRSSRAAQATPIITVSAADELMHSEALAAGADLALRKPCLPQELHAAVRAFLDRGDRKEVALEASSRNRRATGAVPPRCAGKDTKFLHEVAEKSAYYLNRKRSVVALVSKGVRLPNGPWHWVADGSSAAAWQVEKMLGDVFPVLKSTVLEFITLTSESDVRAFEQSLQDSA